MAPTSAAIPPMTWTAPLPTSSCTSNLAQTVIGYMHESINLFSIRVVLPEMLPFGPARFFSRKGVIFINTSNYFY